MEKPASIAFVQCRNFRNIIFISRKNCNENAATDTMDQVQGSVCVCVLASQEETGSADKQQEVAPPAGAISRSSK